MCQSAWLRSIFFFLFQTIPGQNFMTSVFHGQRADANRCQICQRFTRQCYPYLNGPGDQNLPVIFPDRHLKIVCSSFWVIPEEADSRSAGLSSFQGITIIGNRQTRRRRVSRTVQEQPFANPLVLSSMQKLRNILYGLTEEHRALDREIDQAQVSETIRPPIATPRCSD